VGELDLIARKGGAVIFFEVKTRHLGGSHIYSPFEAVDYKKKEQIRKVAMWYIYSKKKDLKSKRVREFRFDIITILYSSSWLKYNMIVY